MAIKENQVITLIYELKDATSKEVLDTNKGAKGLEFILGKGQIIPGLENRIKELENGAKEEILIEAKEAYGTYNEEAKQVLPKEQFAGIELSKGMTLFGQGEDGQSVQVIVADFNDENVTVDYNHPLAGKDLLFDIEISDVREATEDELQSGVIASSCGCGCGSHDDGDDCCGGGHDDGECCGTHEQGSCGCGGH